MIDDLETAYRLRLTRAEQVCRETRRSIGETQKVVDQSRRLIEESRRIREGENDSGIM
jgi:hypothetical protein